jgi:ABC-2 type transport system ATP-binding protein
MPTSGGGAAMIEVDELSKRFGRVRAVDRVSFSVQQGEVVGLLGPNGSGKTTLMRVLTGFFPPTSGRAAIAGRDVQEESMEVRRRVGYVPEHVVLYPELPVRRFLQFVADVKGVRRAQRRTQIDGVIEGCGLQEVVKRQIGKLSRGYRQRVAIAQALLNDPEILILDEPTVGLDPRQTVEIRNLLRELGGRRTLLLCTHILSEVSLLCGRVIVVDRGRVVAEDSAAALSRRLEGATRTLIRVEGPYAEIERALRAVPGVRDVEVSGQSGADADLPGQGFVVTSSGEDVARRELAEAVVRHDWGLLEVRPIEPSLEELFVRLVGTEGKGGGRA